MRQRRTNFFFRTLLIIVTITCFEHCKEKSGDVPTGPTISGDLKIAGFQLQIK